MSMGSLEVLNFCNEKKHSILQNRINGHWCFNCCHFVETDDIFTNKKHCKYLNDKLEQIKSPRLDYLVCICLDCVFYRIQKCIKCSNGNPLCMFSLAEWFDSKPKNRTCIDCTALNETQDILKQLSNLCASQCILQCNACFQYKYVFSFFAFTQAYGNNACCVIRDLDIHQDQKQYKLIVCLECRLKEDVESYRQILKERYFNAIAKEPVLTSSFKVNEEQAENFFGRCTYVNALVGTAIKSRPFKVDIKSVIEKLPPDEINLDELGPVSVLCTMKDYVCELLCKVLESEILLLRSKTELELKLINLPVDIWDEVLQKKMQFTTHMFSLQSSGLSNFHDPESRWAYTAVYTPVHASMIYDIISEGRFNYLLKLIHDACQTSEMFHVSCFGCGPGSEILGLNPFLPNNVKYNLFDNCALWSHNARGLLKLGLGIDYDFFHFDIEKKLKSEHVDVIRKSKILTFVKFISAIQNQLNARKSFEAIFDAAPSGACFLIIDNSQPQIKQYVESLIFPNSNFSQKLNFKENDKYRMYTSYAEFRFDVMEVMNDHEEICKLLSLVMEWVERPPLVDIRIFMFLVTKK
ncbi:uncharacterized protein LOC100198745 [Hydra vulgaris]|uniref:uncharacterized protein LOC100198745 n=1 Tax=Hydra vulgaris TaxID=6087 RepID=UPI0001924C51|nr:uncharacterized protein LOC100198745 [Hydra vulgaris]